jgi:hypothetical protein
MFTLSGVGVVSCGSGSAVPEEGLHETRITVAQISKTMKHKKFLIRIRYSGQIIPVKAAPAVNTRITFIVGIRKARSTDNGKTIDYFGGSLRIRIFRGLANVCIIFN